MKRIRITLGEGYNEDLFEAVCGDVKAIEGDHPGAWSFNFKDAVHYAHRGVIGEGSLEAFSASSVIAFAVADFPEATKADQIGLIYPPAS